MSYKFLGFALVLMFTIQVVNFGYTANSYNPSYDYKIITKGEKVRVTRSQFGKVKNNAKKLLEVKEQDRIDAEVKKQIEEEKIRKQIEEKKRIDEDKKKALELEIANKKAKEVADKKSATISQPIKVPSANAPSSQISGTKQEWMMAAGIPESEWTYVDYIVTRESTWKPNAVNTSSGACGLAQALPCAKTGCANYADPVCSLKWQHGYVKSRYGSYANAYVFWSKNHWY